jgi:hypothetical protein
MFFEPPKDETRLKKTLSLELDMLSDADHIEMAEIKVLLDQQSTFSVESKLRLLDPSLIRKITIHSPALNAILAKPTALHTQTWSMLLKKGSYPSFVIHSLDGKEELSILSQYLAAYYLVQSKQHEADNPLKAAVCLDRACEYGLFDALKKRINLNADKLSTSVASPAILKEFQSDTDRIANLYWSIGHLHAARTSENIVLETTVEASDQAQPFFVKAVTHLLWAKELSQFKNLTENRLITSAILGDKGLDIFGYSSWELAEQDLLSHVDSKQTPHESLMAEVKLTVLDLVRTLYSSIGSPRS